MKESYLDEEKKTLIQWTRYNQPIINSNMVYLGNEEGLMLLEEMMGKT